MRASMRVDVGARRPMEPHDADRRIGLVDRAIGLDAQRDFLGTRSPVPSAVVPWSPVRV